MKKEIWKKIPGYPNHEVSNMGNVKSLNYHREGKERLMKLSLSGSGYRFLRLSKDGNVKTFNVSVLIAMAFLNHKPDGTRRIVVDHINEKKTDDRLENLQLITHRENLSRSKKGCSSKYTGVCRYKTSGKWVSHINVNGKQKYLGTFTNELEAAEAYQKALASLKQKNPHHQAGAKQTKLR